MELLGKIIARPHVELLRTAVAAVFLFLFIYIHSALVNYDLLLKFSVVERAIVFLLVAFVTGRFASMLGEVLIKMLSVTRKAMLWLLYERQRIQKMVAATKTFFSQLRTPKKIQRKLTVTSAEVTILIEEEPALKNKHDDLLAATAYWRTALGLSLLFFVPGISNHLFPVWNIAIFFVIIYILSFSQDMNYQDFWENVCVLAFEKKTKPLV